MDNNYVLINGEYVKAYAGKELIDVITRLKLLRKTVTSDKALLINKRILQLLVFGY